MATTIEGGEGSEPLNGTGGADYILGHGGDDGLLANAGNDTLEGGDGNDTLQGASGNDRLFGGNGDDQLDPGPWDFGSDFISGGAGNDTFFGAQGNDTLDGGEDDDLFIIEYQKGNTVLATGGEGADEFRFGHMASLLQPSPGAASYTVTDFDIAGDTVDLAGLLTKSSEVGAYEGGNPFDQGVLRWRYVSSTGDSFLDCDVDASGAFRTWQNVLILRDVNWHNLTAANFVGAVDPDGGSVPGQEFSGTVDGDSINGGFFNDTITGDGGNDTLNGGGGDDSIDGGVGNDVIASGPGKDTMLGGTGDDAFEVSFANQGAVATGGEGRDVYIVATTPFNAGRDYAVTDFDTGAEGDLIDIDELISQSANPLTSDEVHFTGGNPFDSLNPFLKLEQVGEHVELRWDRDGPNGTDHEWRTVLTLRDTVVGEITSGHIVHGLDPLGELLPDGVMPPGAETAETMEGGYGDDTLGALGGNDLVLGYLGDDSIDAGSGDDTVEGGLGNDTMLGGDGDDRFGPSGVDPQLATKMLGDDEIFGGLGRDHLDDNYGSNLLDGGEGDDFLSAHAGDDGATTLVGGEGRDQISFFGDSFNSNFVMEDFEAGPGGDLLEVDSLLGKSIGPDGNPFTLGYLKLTLTEEGDTLIRWDRDGKAGTKFTLKTQLRLLGVTPGEITSDNFVGQLVIGTEGRDDLLGGIGNDTVQGLGGNDTLNGSLGADTLQGGFGEDLYIVDHVDDEVIEDNNNFPGGLVLGGGRAGLAGDGITDIVRAAVSYGIGNFIENLTLVGDALNGTGNELANLIKGNAKGNNLLGLDGNDRLEGSSGKDTLDGGGGSDRLIGGTGDDTLVWSAGNDTLDGGGGIDSLKIDSGNVDLPGGNRIVNVEIVNLTGGDSSTLTVTRSDVLAMSPTDVVKILGDEGDVVSAAGFSAGAISGGFRTYKSGAATLLVDTDVTVV